MKINKFKKTNSSNELAIESIKLLPDQIRQVLTEARLIKIPREYSKVTQVVINGMGGSNIGGGIVKAAFGDKIKVPISISPGYGVPAHVNKNTLYIISSYSGSTEEPLSTYKEAKKRKAKIIAITSSGGKKLEKLMIKDNIPGYIFNPKYNPSSHPRLGLGYAVFGMALLIAKAGLFKIQVKEIEDIIVSMEIWTRWLTPNAGLKNNSAKKLAEKFYSKQLVLIGAEFLGGNIRALRNQICESSKNFTSYLSLPDLNHFAMEGLSYPKSNKNNLAFLFFDSDLYHPRMQKRSQLTKEVIKKNGIKVVSYKLSGSSKLMQAFELLQLGSWLSYYLGVLNNVDPLKIYWVDWFKKQLR